MTHRAVHPAAHRTGGTSYVEIKPFQTALEGDIPF